MFLRQSERPSLAPTQYNWQNYSLYILILSAVDHRALKPVTSGWSLPGIFQHMGTTSCQC